MPRRARNFDTTHYSSLSDGNQLPMSAPSTIHSITGAPTRIPVQHYFVKTRMTLADMWRKKMDAMKDKDKMSTTNGSL